MQLNRKFTVLTILTLFLSLMLGSSTDQAQAAATAGVLGGGIAINEVLPDPNGTNNFDTDGNGSADTLDEFVEIYNLSGSTIDIGDFELWDDGVGLWFTFPSGTMLGPGNYAFVIAGVQSGGSLPTLPAGNLAFDAGRTSGAINNGGDNVVLYDPGADEYIQILYNGDAADNPPVDYGGFSATATLVGSVEDWGNDSDGISLVREPAGDTNVVQHNTVSAANASPGDASSTAADTAPSVSSTTPADGATNVAVDTDINITFSEDVAVATGWFDISCSSSGSHTATESGGPSVFTLNPDVDFVNDESCTVTIFATQVTDTDTDDPPDSMDADFSFSFDTETAGGGGPADLVISEIMYNSASSENDWEWIEIYNAGAAAVDLSGYVVDDINGSAHGAANIASGTVNPGETAVLYNADDISAADFSAAWGSGFNLVAVTGWDDMSLNNGGDTVSLWDSFASYSGDHETHANALDTVPYDDSSPWPVDDGSASIYLTDLAADNSDGSNWALSAVGVSTPTFTGYQSAAAGGNSGNDVGSPGDPVSNPVISEIMYNPASGEDDWEWVEIYNPGIFAIDLSGYVIDDSNGTAHGTANIASGTVNPGETAVLYNADDVTSADFEAAWGTGINLVAVTDWGAMGLNNGGDMVSLWDSFASYSSDHETHANAIDTVDYDDDGTVWPSDDGSASIYLTDLAADNNDGSNWALSAVGVSTPTFTGYQSFANGGNSGNDVGSPGPNPIVEVCGDPATPIHAIQGSGFSSPEEGNVHSIEGVVIADFQGTDGLEGFFVQEEDSETDTDPATSEGIFVFDDSFGVDVSVGDVVRVRGEVDEFFGLTEITFVSDVQVCNSGASVTVTNLDLPVSDQGDFEPVEGMLVTFSETLYVTDSFNWHRFGEIIVSESSRQFTPTNFMMPGPAAGDSNMNAVADINENGRLLVDDGSDAQFPDPPPNLGPGGTLRLGDSVTGLTGAMSFGFGNYRLQPTAINIDRTNPRQPTPTDFGGDLRVASVNTLNYWTTLDDGNNDARGADSVAEFERQQDKLVAEILALNADIVGLQELEANGTAAISSLVTALNDATAPGTWAFIADPAYPGGLDSTNAIKVGIIYRPGSVTPVGAAVADDDPIFAEDRPPVAQTFDYNGELFTVIVNHFKSKGCSDATGLDTDQGDGQGCYNERRTNQALALIDFVATMQTTSGDDDVLVLGDFNSYTMEDPITTLGSQLINQTYNHVAAADRYSFVFFGQAGLLDYAFTSNSLDNHVTGVEVWHINADEPRALSYNDEVIDPAEGNSAFQQDSLYVADQYRASDHDPVIVTLDFGLITNADGCFVVELDGSPHIGAATIVPLDHPSVQVGSNGQIVFNAAQWGRFNGLGRHACFEIHGTDGVDLLLGGNLSDTFFGYAGNDQMNGNNGNDIFNGGTGADKFIGNGGFDTVIDYEPGTDSCKSIEAGC